MHGATARLAALALRDAACIGATLMLWQQALLAPDHWGWAATTALATAFCGYLVHEWGHLLGAWWRRCAIEHPATPFESFFLFRFKREENTPRQFFSMVLGGFAASILTVLFLLWALPWGVLASTLTFALTAAGVIATFVIEVPEFMRVWRGGPIPSGAAFIKGSERE